MLGVRSCFILPATLLLAVLFTVVSSDLLEDYNTCKDHGFANSTYVCDVDGLLTNKTVTKLEKILYDIQTSITCRCTDNRELCYRNPGNGISTAYMVVLIATTSDKVANENLNETMQTIYYDAKLGQSGCDNGMLVVFIKDAHKIATYRGPRTYGLLTEDEIKVLNARASKSSDDTGLEFLFRSYKSELDQTPSYILSYAPVIGMAVAAVLILVSLSLIVGLLCACCFGRRGKKEDKNLAETGSYRKTIEPVYVVTEPSELTIAPEVVYTAPYISRSSTPSRAYVIEKIDPPFLDPHRQTEVQTREEFVE